MSVSLFSLTGSTIAATFPFPSAPFLQLSAQASTAEEMAIAAQKLLDDLEVRNAAILADPVLGPNYAQKKLTICDASLAGGGDGHTFVLTVSVVPNAGNLLQALLTFLLDGFITDLSPQFWSFQFALAGDGENLPPQLPALAARALAGAAVSPDSFALVPFNMTAGAAKGTRFMYGVGCIGQTPAPG
jgi:hypothetical protein